MDDKAEAAKIQLYRDLIMKRYAESGEDLDKWMANFSADLETYVQRRLDAERAGFVVLQAETCEGDGGLWAASTEFSDRDAALRFIESVIRDNWQIEVDDDTENPRPLADCRGYVHPKGSVKHSTVYYSEDGDEAWAMTGDGSDAMSMAIKLVERKKEGERSC